MKGSYFKRGKTWTYVVDIGKDNTGKRKQKKKGGFKTKKEAEKACNELIAQVNKGEFIEPSRLTLKEFLHEWMETAAKQTLRITTLEAHDSSIRNHINPELGAIRLNQLMPIHIQKFYAKKLDEGLSPSSVLRIHSVLSSSLGQAVKWQLIPKNPVNQVARPKKNNNTVKTWTPDDVNHFLTYTKGGYLHIAYLLAIYTGMRRGEILGLRWEDCDFEQGTLSIRQTLVSSKKGLIFEDTKSIKSRRMIVVTDEVIEALKRHKRQQNKNKLLLGEAYQDHQLVVCTRKGTPMSPRNLNRHYSRMIKLTGVPKVRFHDLRHSHATIMLQLGEHPKVVSERLGHSGTNITMETYSHVLPSIQTNAAEKFSQALKNTRKSL